MSEKTEMKTLAINTQSVYERQGVRYDAERAKILFERKWLSRFEEFLPQEATILDVGCGSGEPIAHYFIQNGHHLTGIDYAESMIKLAKKRFPDNQWHLVDMRNLDLPQQYDGIIGWHSFFHLTPEEQRSTLVRFAGHLKAGGVLMVTVGTEEGEVVGHVAGERVYHSSLAPEAYRQILNDLGMEIIDFVFEDPQCDYATVLLAQKK